MSDDRLNLLASELAGEDIPYIPDDEVSTTEEVSAEADEVRLLAENDVDFLGALVLPTMFKFCFPHIFKQGVWPWLLEYVHQKRVFPRLALGLPRGFAKTTLVKLFLVYCILFTDKKFILIIGSKAEKAEAILSDVCDMLNEPNVLAVFGDWKLGIEKDTQKLKKFGFRGRNIILAASGPTGTVRGMNFKNERPDVMVFDDMQTREAADSKVQSEELEKFMYGTAMKAKSPEGCMYLFIANMYPTPHSLLRKIKHNPTWIKFITGGILEDGTSLWEELHPIASLLDEYQCDLASNHPEIFFSEVMNDETAQANNLVDLSALPELTHEPGDIPAGNYVIVDPSNDKDNSDDVAIGYFEVHNTIPVAMEVLSEVLSPKGIIEEAIKLALKHNCRAVFIESVAFQYSLNYWFKFICLQRGIQGLEVYPIYPGSSSKNTRIIKMLRGYAAGELAVDMSQRPLVHSQITGFNPLKTDNTDDILDLLAYATRIVVEYPEIIVLTNLIEHQEYDAIDVPINNSSF